jgi:hypothetical protein
MTSRPLSALTMLLSRHTKRREFISLLGGAAAWPLVARAQQAGSIRRAVVLMGAAETAWSRGWLASFLRRLDELGWREGRNLVTQEDIFGCDRAWLRQIVETIYPLLITAVERNIGFVEGKDRFNCVPCLSRRSEATKVPSHPILPAGQKGRGRFTPLALA